jgi:superfamily II DNA or RNA helicase
MASNAYYRYGITATTDKRHDSADMEYYGLLGERLSRISASDLIETGYISPATVIFQRWGYMPFYGSVKFQGVGGVEDQALVYNHQRNTQICDDILNALGEGRRVMVMVRRLDHGKLLKQILESRISENVRMEWVHGEHPEKAKIIEEFRDKKIQILIAQNQLLSEGVDIPDVSAVVMAAGGKSAIKTIQSIGRGIRKAEGKVNLVVYDYADEGRYIQEHALQRLNTYAAESAFKIEAEGTNLENYIQHLRDIGHGI